MALLTRNVFNPSMDGFCMAEKYRSTTETSGVVETTS
jgi:hypothetical protein